MKVFSSVVVVGLGVLFLAGCATGPSARIARDPERFAAFPEEVQENIRAGNIEIGYTKEMVRMAFGEPDRVSSRRTEGAESVIWSYRTSRPRLGFSVGTGFGGASRSSGAGVSVGTGGRPTEERGRVVFEEGQVTAIEMRE